MKTILDYKKVLQVQRLNSRKNPNFTYLTWLYAKIQSEIEDNSSVLEIGSGAGISDDFLKGIKVLKTDILDWEDNSVIGNVDAERLPFNKNEFDYVISVDVLHHTNSPLVVLNECLRVLKPKGKLLIIEPYVSMFSFFVYKVFHHEDTSWKIDLKVMSNLEKENQ